MLSLQLCGNDGSKRQHHVLPEPDHVRNTKHNVNKSLLRWVAYGLSMEGLKIVLLHALSKAGGSKTDSHQRPGPLVVAKVIYITVQSTTRTQLIKFRSFTIPWDYQRR